MANTEFGSAGNYPAGANAWSGQPRKVAMTNSEAQQGFTPNNPVLPESLNYLFGCAFPDIQVFDTPGAGVWTKPAGAQICEIIVIGAGGGGASGAGGITSAGGGGGGSGYARHEKIPASMLSATVDVIVSAGAAGGAGGAGLIINETF